MIHVTQGHEKGIGLEVFLKSLIYLSIEDAKRIVLYANKDTLNEHCKILPYSMSVLDHSIRIFDIEIKVDFFKENTFQSTHALEHALASIKGDDVLFTLPTSKDQLLLNGEKVLGYTEFLRKKYKDDHLVMSFKSNNEQVCLLTDHIPLAKVASTLSLDYIISKSRHIFDALGKDKEYYFCGINPHSGENGLLGSEESTLKQALEQIKENYPNISIYPEIIPADTHHFYKSKKSVFIFTSHDQALTVFKSNNGIMASNITLGLPFKRLSVDHGVAFTLYGNNKADSTGCLFCLNQCLDWDRNEQ